MLNKLYLAKITMSSKLHNHFIFDNRIRQYLRETADRMFLGDENAKEDKRNIVSGCYGNYYTFDNYADCKKSTYKEANGNGANCSD